MTRYSHLRWLAPLGGLVAAGVIALSALPAHSTIVCPTGIKPPSPYCTNVPPTASTGSATKVTAKKATLNGVAGPNVKGGDITQYFFKYGTSTGYGSQTPTGTIGSCPAGITPPSPYCNVPASQSVSANITGLSPCTTYHFQLFANNPDGSAAGGDKTFQTPFTAPLQNVNAPNKVNRRRQVQGEVHAEVRHRAGPGRHQASARPGGDQHDSRPAWSGKHTVTLHAPSRRGNYILEVIAKLSCGHQTVSQRLRVH